METALILYTQADNTPYLVDLYENENISLNYSFNDIKDLTPRGNFSRTFRIPFTETNAKIFGFVQENTFQFSGFNPKRKINASITVDTIPIIEGYVQFKAAYTSNGEVSDLEIVFFGNVVDFFKTIGDADFKNYIATELTTDYPIDITFSTIDDVASYTDIQFGLTDRGNKWVGNSLSDGRSIYVNPFDTSEAILAEIVKPFELTPFVWSRYIFDKIFALSGFQFNEANSATLVEQLEKMWIPFTSEGSTMLMIGGNGDQAVYRVEDGIANITFDGGDFSSVALSDGSTIYSYTIPAMNIVNDPGSNISGNNVYTAPFGGNFIINSVITIDVPLSTVFTGTGFVDINLGFLITNPVGDKSITPVGLSSVFELGVLQAGTQTKVASLGPTLTDEFYLESGSTVEVVLWVSNISDITSVVPANGLQFLDISLETTEPFNQNSNIECVSASKSYGNPIDWKINAPIMKCSEFMSSLFKMFNLVVIPDDINPKLLTLKPIQEYLDEGTTKDWSNKLDISKDITLTATADYQAQKNLWTYKQSNDYLNNIYNSQGNRVYGRLELVDPENDFATNDYKVESFFFPSPCALINNTDLAIPKYINESGTYVAPGPRILYKTNNEIKVDIYDNETGNFVSRFFPLFNHYTRNVPTLADEDLNFGQEVSLQRIDSQPWKTLYARYWNKYIADIYAPDARIIEAFFALDFADIYQFKYNDQIFIKDSYWRILEISDYVVGMQDTVKVKLIKVVSATPDCLLVPDNVLNLNGTVPFLDGDGNPATATESCCNLYGYLWVNDNCFAKVPDGKTKTLRAGNSPELLTTAPIKVNDVTTLIATPNNSIDRSVLNTMVYGERNVVERNASNSLVGGTDAKAINSGVTIGSGGTYAGQNQSGIIQLNGFGTWTNSTTSIDLLSNRAAITMPNDSVWYIKLMIVASHADGTGIDFGVTAEFNFNLQNSGGISLKNVTLVDTYSAGISGDMEVDMNISGSTFNPIVYLKNSSYPIADVNLSAQLIYTQYHYE
jgi:hypothetical protein